MELKQEWSDIALEAFGAGVGTISERLSMALAAVLPLIEAEVRADERAKALAEALAEPDDAEINASTPQDDHTQWMAYNYKRARILFRNRLRRLTAKPDPHVTVLDTCVFLDGAQVAAFGGDDAVLRARNYADALRQKEAHRG